MSNELATEVGQAAGDFLSVGVLIGTLAQYLPAIAALFTIIWTAIRIYETKTVQGCLNRRAKE